MKTEIKCNYSPWKQEIELCVFKIDKDVRSIAKPLVFIESKISRSSRFEPTASLDLITAQELMDELWRCGLRPTEGKGSAGSLAATQNHLADMQKIAFSLLEKGKGK